MADIKRIGQSPYSPTRGRIVTHHGTLTTVATATNKVASTYDQGLDALANVDHNLAEAGTHKGQVLTVWVYLANMQDKPEFNRAWDEWVDRDNLPVRACLGVDLEGDDLVELVVTAAVDD